MRTETTKRQANAATIREDRLNALLGKYFDMFCSTFEYGRISRDKFRKIMAFFWTTGSPMAVQAKGAAKLSEALGEVDNSLMGICSYAPMSWNLDGVPLDVVCQYSTIPSIGGINFATMNNMVTAETKLLPIDKILRNGKNCVIGYALQSHQPVSDYVRQVLNYILDAEVAIRNNQIAMGLQTTITATKNDMIRAAQLQDQILSGNPVKIISSKTENSISFPASGISDFTAGQYQLIINRENEIKTYLGIRNIGNIEKKERVNQDEAQSNNEETDIGADGIDEMIRYFCEEVKEVLGFDFYIRRKNFRVEETQKEDEPEDQGDDENANQ